MTTHGAPTGGASQSAETIHIDDGRAFVLRSLRPDDLPALHRAFSRLTPEEIEYRFFHRSRELPVSVQRQVRTLDPACDAAFVLDDGGEIRGVADLHMQRPDSREAEFGLIVGKAIAGHGLGTLLMQRLLAEAGRRALTLRGLVRRDNARMLELCRAFGGTVSADPDDPAIVSVSFAPNRWR
ncbi:MAG TPA: GNAT family N-acetyltransferase [Rhodanobacteraceae bacterium]|nr:GNAT family N-acetyltransferase [Rhodanobacteraceae bacterium]